MDVHVPFVVFNAHLLAGGATYRSAGISVYIQSLLRKLLDGDHGVRLHVMLSRHVPDTAVIEDGQSPVGADMYSLAHARLATGQAWQRVLWEQILLPLQLRRLRADLLHAPAYVAPLASPCPTVVTVHDLSFLRSPEFFRRRNRLYLGALTRLACQRAAAVITISDYTAQEVRSLLGVPESRIFKIYPGVASRFRPLLQADVAHFRRERGLPDRFVLFLGTLEPRKNLIRLIQAFARLPDKDVHLVIAGAKGWFYEAIFAEVERLDMSERVHFPGFVPEEEQVLWYNAAHLFAYVSNCEGFGMPVLEALACGTPTVTAATTSMPEVGGGAAAMVPPDDVAAMADVLHDVLTDTQARAAMRETGLQHAARFSWAEAARQTAQVYRAALGYPPVRGAGA